MYIRFKWWHIPIWIIVGILFLPFYLFDNYFNADLVKERRERNDT